MRLTIAILILIIFTVPCYGKSGLQEQIAAEIDALLIEGNYSYKVIAVSEAVDGFFVVSLNPPYREFPNIILFRTVSGSSIKRIYEAFSLGIQDQPSGLLDLHTDGKAVDFILDSDKAGSSQEKMIQNSIRIFEQEGGTLIWYGKFLHGHFGQKSKQRYFIDKSGYKSYALKLLGEQYNEYPDRECVMYDTPDLKETKFYKKNGMYHLQAKTANKQQWTIAFKGVDGEDRYLTEKTITVNRLK